MDGEEDCKAKDKAAVSSGAQDKRWIVLELPERELPEPVRERRLTLRGAASVGVDRRNVWTDFCMV